MAALAAAFAADKLISGYYPKGYRLTTPAAVRYITDQLLLFLGLIRKPREPSPKLRVESKYSIDLLSGTNRLILAAVNFSFGMFPSTTEKRFAEILQHILLQTMKIDRVKSYNLDNVCRAISQYIQGLQRTTEKTKICLDHVHMTLAKP